MVERDREDSEFLSRDCVANDHVTLLGIEMRSGDSAWSGAQLMGWITAHHDGTRVIATHARPDIPIGFLMVQEAAGCLYVANISVAPGWRRRGVATFALGHVEEIARRSGYDRIVLDVLEDNLPAQLLYRKAGFRAVEIRGGHFRGRAAYRMQKDLRPSD